MNLQYILREQNTGEEFFAYHNGMLHNFHSTWSHGLFAGVSVGTKCGFATAPYPTNRRVLLERAGQNAELLSNRKTTVPESLLASWKAKPLQCTTGPIWEWQRLLLAEAEQFLKAEAGRIGTEVRLHRVQEDMAVWDPLGNRREQHTLLDHLELELTGRHKSGQEILFSQAMWLRPELQTEAVFSFLHNTLQQFRDCCTGTSPETKISSCILSPQVTAMLIHEAVGHLAEADGVQAGSALQGCLHKKIAQETVSVVDFANQAFDQPIPLPFFFDHVGTEAVDTILIRNGYLQGYLHSTETTDKPEELTGHARAESYRDPTMIRMRNTALLPGEETFASLLERVQDGYYLCTTAGGQANLAGDFSLQIPLAYRISNGKLQHPVTGCLVSGNALTVLKSIKGISNIFEWVGNRLCSKGQLVPVAMGGPHLLCELKVQ